MSILIKIARRFTPQPYKFVFLQSNPEVTKNLRRDVVTLDLGNNSFLELYWKSVDLGRGPAVILNVQGYEIMRFDCFGNPGGHFHYQVTEWRRPSEQRMRLPELTAEDQIDRALVELRYTIRWVQDRHPLPRVRNTAHDSLKLHEVTENAREIVISYRR